MVADISDNRSVHLTKIRRWHCGEKPCGNATLVSRTYDCADCSLGITPAHMCKLGRRKHGKQTPALSVSGELAFDAKFGS